MLDIVLDIWGEKVALYRGNTFRWLRGDDIDAEDATIRFGEFDSYLNVPHKRVSFSYHYHVKPKTVVVHVLATMTPAHSPDL